MKDEIIIIVKRDGEYHKLNQDRHIECDNCSLCGCSFIDNIDVCDICTLLYGRFEKVETKTEEKKGK